MSCHVITLACRVMSWHVGVGGFWLGHLAISDNGNLQVRFHDDIDGSSLARAIYASTGPLLIPFDSGFPTHSKPLDTIFHTRKSVLNIVVSN